MTKTLLALGLALSIGMAPSLAQAQTTPEESYGDNIIRISPITVLDIGVGPGISYEHILTQDKKMSFILPFSFLFNDEDNYRGNNYRANSLNYLYFTPGIKFYPSGQKHINYAIGANLMVGYGGGTRYHSYWPLPPQKEKTFRLGVLVNNYVNFQISPNFNLGLTGGLGVRYLDHRKVSGTGPAFPFEMTYNEVMTVTGEFSFTLGYRF